MDAKFYGKYFVFEHLKRKVDSFMVKCKKKGVLNPFFSSKATDFRCKENFSVISKSKAFLKYQYCLVPKIPNTPLCPSGHVLSPLAVFDGPGKAVWNCPINHVCHQAPFTPLPGLLVFNHHYGRQRSLKSCLTASPPFVRDEL